MDLAAKDKRCTRFDADFCVELLFLPLQGQVGTGPALDAARAARGLLRSCFSGSSTSSFLLRHNLSGSHAGSFQMGHFGGRASAFGGGPGGGGLVGEVPATQPPAREQALHWEKEGYSRFLRQLPCVQCVPPALEDWLLGRSDDPATTCPGGALCRWAAVEAAAPAPAPAAVTVGAITAGTDSTEHGQAQLSCGTVVPEPEDAAERFPRGGAAAAAAAALQSPYGGRGRMGGDEGGTAESDYVVLTDWTLVTWPSTPSHPPDGGLPFAG